MRRNKWSGDWSEMERSGDLGGNLIGDRSGTDMSRNEWRGGSNGAELDLIWRLDRQRHKGEREAI